MPSTIHRDLAFETLLAVLLTESEIDSFASGCAVRPTTLVARARRDPELERRLFERLCADLGPQTADAIEPLVGTLRHQASTCGLLQVIWQAGAHSGQAWARLERRAVRRLHHIALSQLWGPLALAAK